MNDAHLHLIINHFPIIVPIIGMVILLVGFFTKSDVVKRTAFGVFILGAILTFPAMYTGEGAEEIAEKLPGVTDQLIHQHEENAETFAIVSYILGLISLLGFWANYKQKYFANWVAISIIVLGTVGLYLGKVTGTSGGEIRHTEIRASYDATQGITPKIKDTEGDHD